MRRAILVMPALIVLTLAILHFVPAMSASAPASTRDIHNNPMSREVRATLIEAFGPDALNIVVGVDQNVAVLSGDVNERPTQRLAEEVAASVEGIIAVHNFLDLASNDASTPTVRVAGDISLKTRVSGELEAHVGARAPDISVDACDGVVLLLGTLPDTNRHDAAIRVAEGLTGVKRVIDLLHVAWTGSFPSTPVVFEGEAMTPYGPEK